MVAFDRVPRSSPSRMAGAVVRLRPSAARSARPLTWGEAMLGGHLRLLRSCSWPTASCRTSGSPGPTTSSAGAPTRSSSARARRSSLLDVGSAVHHHASRPSRDIIVVGHLRRLPRRADRRCSRGGRTGARPKPSAEVETSAYGRPLVKALSAWPAPTPTRRCPSSATTTCSQEVDADYLDARRSSRSSSSTSTRPSASCARAASTSARGSASTWSRTDAIDEAVNTEQPGDDPSDHVVFIIDEDVCTRCALCVDRCPTGVIILGKVGDRRRRRRPPRPHQHATATPTACGF